MRFHGVNSDGEELSSQFVDKGVHDFSTPVTELDADGNDLYPSKTRQEFAAECDINVLMERYEKTGIISHVDQRIPNYVDVSDLPSYQESFEIVRRAAEAFASLPARARAEFDNDPGAFADYAADPANLERMREWGLAAPAPAPEVPAAPMEVVVVDRPAEPPKGS